MRLRYITTELMLVRPTKLYKCLSDFLKSGCAVTHRQWKLNLQRRMYTTNNGQRTPASQPVPPFSGVKQSTGAEVAEALDSQVQPDNLSTAEVVIHEQHSKAMKEKKETYEDPATGFTTFTAHSHLKRGYCCGGGCRHCPYGLVNVPEGFREDMVWNSAFYKSKDS